jgi:porphobilinogen synthase
MVKPTLPYLDILSAAQTLAPDHPLACYQVSGEYAMIVAGAEKGIYGLEEMVMETMDSFLRAGVYARALPQFLRSR